jgi:MGT family glycosyltransferase
MSRRHIAVFMLPYRSHIYPVLGICQELKKRGYRVTVATSEHTAHLVRQAGIEPAIFNIGDPGSTNFGDWPTRDPRWWEFIADSCLSFARLAALSVAQLEVFYRENPPDAVLYDNNAYAGRIIAKYTNSITVQFYTSFPKDKFFTWEDGIGRNPQPILDCAKALIPFFSSYGIDGSNHFWHKADLNISPVPGPLQYENEFDSDQFCLSGPCLRSSIGAWKSNSNGRKCILVSDMAGMTDVDYFKTFIAALSGLDYNVILSVGEKTPVERFLPQPENFEINQHVSHLDILPHVNLLISPGGAGSALEALYFGVPMLTLPRWPPEEVMAYRIDALGLGLNLPRHSMTPEIISSNVARVLGDTEIASRVRRMQHIVKNCGGAALAADKIEEAL